MSKSSVFCSLYFRFFISSAKQSSFDFPKLFCLREQSDIYKIQFQRFSKQIWWRGCFFSHNWAPSRFSSPQPESPWSLTCWNWILDTFFCRTQNLTAIVDLSAALLWALFCQLSPKKSKPSLDYFSWTPKWLPLCFMKRKKPEVFSLQILHLKATSSFGALYF